MRIAIWTDTFPPQVNGVASVTQDLASALTELGHDVAVFTVIEKARIKKSPGDKTFLIHKIPSFSMPKFIYPGEGLSVALMPGPGTIRALRKFKPDIIHVHTPFLAGWGAVLGKNLLRVPLVGTHHTFFDDYLKHVRLDYAWGRNLSWKYTVAYYNRSSAVTTPSRALGAALVAHGLTSPLHIVSNPANTEFFTPAPDAAKKNGLKKKFGIGAHAIVYMGRVSYEKDIDQAIAAFNAVLRDLPDATFMVVGDGPERKKLENLARKLGCDHKVIFTGMLRGEALRDALRANDLFLTASRSENMPISIIEAMACGLPIAAVRAKGIPDIVSHGENGSLAPPGEPELLAREILRIFSSPDDLQRMSAAARRSAEKYSKRNIAQVMVELYETVITQNPKK
jgi:glycosyltransferase involved in cell wall biosynthesis